MIDLKRLVEQMIYDCDKNDVRLYLNSILVFDNKHIKKYFTDCSRQHYTLDNKLLYIDSIGLTWISVDVNILVISITNEYNITKNYRINLKQSLVRLKLQELQALHYINDNILRLCHTGK